MCDLDGFMQLKKELGSVHSDALLRQVAQALLKSTRGIDLVSRFGNDQWNLGRRESIPALGNGDLRDIVVESDTIAWLASAEGVVHVNGGSVRALNNAFTGGGLPSDDVRSVTLAGGRLFVEGNKGDRYNIVAKNESDHRVEVVLSVDGLDVLDGKPACFQLVLKARDPRSSSRQRSS